MKFGGGENLLDVLTQSKILGFCRVVLKRRNLRLIFQYIHPAGTEVGHREVQIIIAIPITGGQSLGLGLARNNPE